jgi:hypothetical protein
MSTAREYETEFLEAIELALAGKWDAAHRIVQRHENDATASWIHAILHKIEGDMDNSRYWYRRAGKMEHAGDEAHAELRTIEAMISGR